MSQKSMLLPLQLPCRRTGVLQQDAQVLAVDVHPRPTAGGIWPCSLQRWCRGRTPAGRQSTSSGGVVHGQAPLPHRSTHSVWTCETRRSEPLFGGTAAFDGMTGTRPPVRILPQYALPNTTMVRGSGATRPTMASCTAANTSAACRTRHNPRLPASDVAS